MKTPVLHNLTHVDVAVGSCETTVRLGEKWALQAPLGSDIALCSCSPSHVVIGIGRVEEIYMTMFQNIPDLDITTGGRTASVRMSELKKAYGDLATDESLVTVLRYRRIS
jgi:hypothetical protein